MADKDPWPEINEETSPKPVQWREWSEVVAGFLAIVMVPLFPLFGLYGALVSLSTNDILSFTLSVLFMLVAGLSIVHALNGRNRNIWLVSVIALVLIYQLDEWERKNSSKEFCQKYVQENCIRNNEGEIERPNATLRCAENVGEDFNF